jgi:hypothetical protein
MDHTRTIAVKAIINSRVWRSPMVVAPVQSPLVFESRAAGLASARDLHVTALTTVTSLTVPTSSPVGPGRFGWEGEINRRARGAESKAAAAPHGRRMARSDG